MQNPTPFCLWLRVTNAQREENRTNARRRVETRHAVRLRRPVRTELGVCDSRGTISVTVVVCVPLAIAGNRKPESDFVHADTYIEMQSSTSASCVIAQCPGEVFKRDGTVRFGRLL